MRRILFVDDERRILEGLQRMLRPQRNVWEMGFAASGDEALSMMEAVCYDVVVTDMRMPHMDGAALLAIVREKYPGTLRIVLSGYAELEASYHAVPVAHQFLNKPCEAEKLRSAIERGTCLIDLVSSKSLASMAGSLQNLPSAPQTFWKLKNELESPEPSIERIVRIIEEDVAIAAKVLQLVNSAFFGMSRDVTEIRTAVTLIGSNILHHLVLSVEAFRSFHPDQPLSSFSLEGFEAHAQLAARIASALSQRERLPKATVIAALLHDVGELVIAERAPAQWKLAVETASHERQLLYSVEERLMGVSHAEVGAYLLGLWGFPFPVIEAVAHHHRPQRAAPGTFDMIVGVYLANALAQSVGHWKIEGDGVPTAGPDRELLESLHVSGKLPEWRRISEELAQQIQPVKS